MSDMHKKNQNLSENYAFVEFLENVNDLDSFYENKKIDFSKEFDSIKAEVKNDNYTTKNIQKLRSAYLKTVKDKSDIYKYTVGLIEQKDINSLLKSLPEGVKTALKNFSHRLTNRDKYVLYKKASDIWELTHNEQYVINDVVQLLFYIKKSYQNPREYLDVHSRVFI